MLSHMYLFFVSLGRSCYNQKMPINCVDIIRNLIMLEDLITKKTRIKTIRLLKTISDITKKKIYIEKLTTI